MVKKVLIGTDGSRHAKRAVEFGADLAAKFGAEVILVHVLLRGELSESLRHMAEVEHLVAEGGRPLAEAISSVPEGPFPASIVISSEDIRRSTRLLHAVAELIMDGAEHTIRSRGVDRVERRTEDGDPVSRMLEVIDAEGADVVVTGARGLSMFKALLLGSVSQKLAHHAPVTSITVR